MSESFKHEVIACLWFIVSALTYIAGFKLFALLPLAIGVYDFGLACVWQARESKDGF